MTDAMDWSVFTRLLRKSEVRATADRANAALDRRNATKSRWSSELRLAYKEAKPKGGPYGSAASKLNVVDPESRILIRKLQEEEQGGSHGEKACPRDV